MNIKDLIGKRVVAVPYVEYKGERVAVGLELEGGIKVSSSEWFVVGDRWAESAQGIDGTEKGGDK